MIYQVDKLKDNKTNPVDNNKYDSSWLILTLMDSDENAAIVGADNGGAYTIKISKSANKNWQLAVGDFMEYCNANHFNAVVEISQEDYNYVLNAYNGHSFREQTLRDYEPRILIHSTTIENWILIQRDGMLKSWNRLKKEKQILEEQPIGIQLGDPTSFSDYIMFGGGVTGEIVVNSKQSGKIVMDIDTEYQTGARLYFDARKMAEDGLLVRDGCHQKVKEVLPLEPYLVWAATWDKIGLSNAISTPRKFAEASDKQFYIVTRAQL